MTHPAPLPSSVTETPETDSDRVSEERLRECPFCGGEATVHNYPNVTSSGRDWFVHCKPCDMSLDAFSTRADAIAAWNRRTTPSLPPRSGGVVDADEDWHDDPAADERWNAGVNYAITQLCEILGVDPKSISWDAATETLDGDVSAVLCNAIRGAYGDDWTSSPDATARIRSTLADPIPEAPADEEVEGLSLEKAVRDAHKTLMNTLDRDFGLWSSPAFAKAREAVYPLWKRLDETLAALRRSTKTDKPGVREAEHKLLAALADLADAFLSKHGCFPLDEVTDEQRHWKRAMARAYDFVGAPTSPLRNQIRTSALSASPLAEEQPVASLQDRVQPWMMACFGPEISADRLERNDRFIEEALELVQASGYPKERAFALVDYVYGRPQGDINQEVGGVMITLAAHCLAHGVDMHEAGEHELARIWTKIEKIRAKQASKPTGSALPVATPESPNV